eukprot:6596552-Karenia_brevis.AAC.1
MPPSSFKDEDFWSLHLMGPAPLLLRSVSFAARNRFAYKHEALLRDLHAAMMNTVDAQLLSTVQHESLASQ